MANGKSQKHSEMIGKRFGRLTVVEDVTDVGRSRFLCECSCGNKKVVRMDYLKRGLVVSCGCYHKEVTRSINKTHGMSKTRLYGIWKGIHNRCLNNNIPGYSLWGGRGITVCSEWDAFEPFYEWAMANGYQDGLSIDRIDNDGNYEPQNCRWASQKEQSRNRRSNAMVTYNGITKHISDWDKDIGSAKSGRVRARLNSGWSIEDAVTIKVGERRR